MDFITEIIKTHGRNAKSGLEIASGSGQHIISFAQEMPQIKWTPSEIKDDALASISEYITDSGLTNISPPKRVDCLERSWELDRYDIIANINMIHISPYNACEGLMMLAGKYLNPGGVLCLYRSRAGRGHHCHRGRAGADGRRVCADLRRDPAWRTGRGRSAATGERGRVRT